MAIFSNRVLLTLVAVATGLPAAWSPGRQAADFALRDGDTVVFLGDSITAARTYGKIVENYTLLRFPGRKVHFHNAGWGGDTAAGGLKRLERDVFAHGRDRAASSPTASTTSAGGPRPTRRTGSSTSTRSGASSRPCKARGVRVFICSAAITAEDPDRSEHGFLQAMCDEGMAVARVAGRARHRRPARDAGDPAHGAQGQRVGEARRTSRPSMPPTASTSTTSVSSRWPSRSSRAWARPRRSPSVAIDAKPVPSWNPAERLPCLGPQSGDGDGPPGVRPARRRPADQLRPLRGPRSFATCRSPTS